MTDQTTIFSQEKLLEMYEALPQQLKEAVFSVDVADKIMKTGQKFGLNVEQTGNLAEATGLVMLGALHPRSFIQKLEETLKIERTKAVDVAKEINHEIFFPIREQLKKLHGMEDTEEVTGERVIERGDILKKLGEFKQRGAAPAPKTDLAAIGRGDMRERVSPSPLDVIKPPLREPERPETAPRRSQTLAERFGVPTKPPAEKTMPTPPAPPPSRPPASESSKRTPSSEELQREIGNILPRAAQEQKPSREPTLAEPLIKPIPKPAEEIVKPRPIPEWAKPAQQPIQKIPMREVTSELPSAPLTIEPKPKKSGEPIRKIPMQEIQPPEKLGPGGDKYKEPIE